ncbi:Homeodomain-like protein [Powellomyces hirtus]|nr:Homeodomain-like protein [Powellomyces hirtus]
MSSDETSIKREPQGHCFDDFDLEGHDGLHCGLPPSSPLAHNASSDLDDDRTPTLLPPSSSSRNANHRPLLSDACRNQIVGMSVAGLTKGQIAARLGVSQSTISRILQRYNKTGDATSLKRRGRKPILPAPETLEAVYEVIKANSRGSLVEFQAALSEKGLNFSRSKVYKIIKQLRMGNYAAACKPLLDDRKMKLRFEWTAMRRHWLAEDWQNCLGLGKNEYGVSKETKKNTC